MVTFVVKKKEEPVNGPYGFGGLGLMALSPVMKLLGGGTLVLLLAAVAWGGVQTLRVKNLQINLLEEQNKTVKIQGQLDNCNNQIEEQNKDIARIAEDARKDVALIQGTVDQLERVIEFQDQNIDRLRETPAPETCEEAQQFLSDNIRVFKEDNE